MRSGSPLCERLASSAAAWPTPSRDAQLSAAMLTVNGSVFDAEREASMRRSPRQR
jgi:hypothetical protein